MPIHLYKCSKCKAEFAAKQEDFTQIPTVVRITSAEEDSTPLPGVVIQGFDLLAANPDPDGHVWYGGKGEVAALSKDEEVIG